MDVAAFGGFAQQRPAAAIGVLQEPGHGGSWPTEMWKAALDAIQADRTDTRPGHPRGVRSIRVLLETPDVLFHDLQHGIVRHLDEISEHWPGTDDTDFWRLWLRAWEHRSPRSSVLSRVDALTHAMNTTAGKYAGTAMKRIQAAICNKNGSITDEQLSILDRILQ